MSIRVLIVDDSATVRSVISQILSTDSEIEVMGTAVNPVFALRKMEQDWPDVIISDVNMPEMDGLTFLKKVMSMRPTPVIMCSTEVGEGARAAVEALSWGAVELFEKPEIGLKGFLNENARQFVRAVKEASHVNVKKLGKRNLRAPRDPASGSSPLPQPPEKINADAMLAPPTAGAKKRSGVAAPLIAIGSSTGGTTAIEEVLSVLPKTTPGIVIVQHMQAKFTSAFAQRLNTVTDLEVKEGATGDIVEPGKVFIAPGGKHMMIKAIGGRYEVVVKEGPPVNRHRPAVDVLFRSAAKEAQRNAIGIILTGMGDDGAAGMLEMRDAGALTFAQDAETCVVYGMPKEAVKRGAVVKQLPLQEIPHALSREVLKRSLK